jgi:hypothetical protein
MPLAAINPVSCTPVSVLLQLEHWTQVQRSRQGRMQLVLPVPAGQVELGVLLVKGEGD